MPQLEVARLVREHHAVQAQIGAGVARQALANWSRVSPTSLVASGSAWLALVLSVVRRERTRSRQVAASYLRLYRALETGHTLPPLDATEPAEAVTLGELRQDWAQHTDTRPAPEADGEVTAEVDDFGWPEPDTAGQDAAARTSLAVTGLASAHRAVGRLDDAGFLAELEAAMNDAGTAAAGAADREALRGGRDLLRDASRTDTRVIGWARITDGDPCGFCAMLAARGAVYRTRQAAGIRGRTGRNLPPVELPEDLEKYHDQCHCQTVPVYTGAFVPEASAQYARDWPRVTRGLAGTEARRAWRRHIEAQRRAAR